MTKKSTVTDVAEWILGEIERDGLLYQEQAVYAIVDKFGEEFTYCNQNGNMAIGRSVLAAFRRMSGDSVVWVRSDRLWRKREDYDEPGREQL